DLHKMAQRYIKALDVEDACFHEQVASLPKDIKKELTSMHGEYRKQASKASMVARDADILECLIQAKEYHEHGFKEAVKFMKKAPKFLRTKSAKKLWTLAMKSNLNNWWVELSEFKR
ncbi:MAG: HD domain-containing protein, partial [Candidatus Omnitrophota bacterium]|nr:HD domain-containing protein [Candidatus Omnitrophota bacterium]